MSGGRISYEDAVASLTSMFPLVERAIIEEMLQMNRECGCAPAAGSAGLRRARGMGAESPMFAPPRRRCHGAHGGAAVDDGPGVGRVRPPSRLPCSCVAPGPHPPPPPTPPALAVALQVAPCPCLASHTHLPRPGCARQHRRGRARGRAGRLVPRLRAGRPRVQPRRAGQRPCAPPPPRRRRRAGTRPTAPRRRSPPQQRRRRQAVAQPAAW
jgi:hypothetical protein